MISTDAARIVVVGAGGLGGPIARIAAATGAAVTIVDDDRVELSNLQRQIQFAMADLGANKAATLASQLGATAVHARLTDANADALLRGTTVVVDATDSPGAKFLISDRAMALGIPYVIASAVGLTGNVMIGAPDAACYRCLFEAPPSSEEAPTCADAGVLGAVVGVVGAHAGAAVVELLEGRRERVGTIDVFARVDGVTPPRTISLARRRDCAMHGAVA